MLRVPENYIPMIIPGDPAFVYDFRGIVHLSRRGLSKNGFGVNSRKVKAFTKSLAYLFKQAGLRGTIAIGGDRRVSTPIIKKIVRETLLKSGFDMIDLGTISTGQASFLANNQDFVETYNVLAVLQVTGSHTPRIPDFSYEENGIKVYTTQISSQRIKPSFPGASMFNPLINYHKELYLRALNGRIRVKGQGKWLGKVNTTNSYVEHLLSFSDYLKLDLSGIKILLDDANGLHDLGIPGDIAREVFSNLNADIRITSLDRNPEPKKENLGPLKREMKKEEIAIAFDGDWDRVFFISQDFEVLDGNDQIALISRTIKKNFLISIQPNGHGAYVRTNFRAIVASVEVRYDVHELFDSKVFLTLVGHPQIEAGMTKVLKKESEDYVGSDGLKFSLVVLKAMQESSFNYQEARRELGIEDMVALSKSVRLDELVWAKEKTKIIALLKRYFERKFGPLSEPKNLPFVDGVRDGKPIFIYDGALCLDSNFYMARVSRTEPKVRVDFQTKERDEREGEKFYKEIEKLIWPI